MTRFMLLTGAAALAVASAATAGPQGKSDKGSAKAAHSQHQAKPGKANRGKAQAARAKDRRSDARTAKASRGKAQANARAEIRGDNRKAAKRDDRRDDRRALRDDRRDDRQALRLDRAERRNRLADNRGNRRGNGNLGKAAVGYGVGGCPPGLRDKGCVPPGQADNFVGQRLSVVGDRIRLRELPQRLRTVYRDTDDYYYRVGNGYAYRINRENDLITSVLPLFGLGRVVGQPFPASYSNSYLPAGLQPFYPNTANTSYRFANGYVYEVNPMTGLIQDVDPMLGYGYGFGQMMPASYSAYNLPYQYRSQFSDNGDHYYRYAPGSIYRVDRGTGLIDSIAALLTTGGMSVGQPLPMGYDAYNLPMQYRSQYYDTPQNMYRYANGNIYQVDPTTRLVTAIISALI